MDKKFGSPWHVVAGQYFSYEITYEVSSSLEVCQIPFIVVCTDTTCLALSAKTYCIYTLEEPLGYFCGKCKIVCGTLT